MTKFLKALRSLAWYLLFDGLILGYAGFIPGMQTAAAQTILTQTTLSAAVTTTSTTFVSVASATGITANSTVLYVADGLGELMFVNSVNGKTIGVTRGSNGGPAASTHASGALVFVAPPNAIASQPPAGSCTRANQLYLPVIAMGVAGNEPVISDCLGGVWVAGVIEPAAVTAFRILAPQPGSVAYTTINTNGTTLAATTMYCTEIDLPYNKLLTGIGILNGTTVGTDNHLVALYDASGNLLANSATAGVLAASASTYQNISFTSTYFAVGPATYFGCMQTNGTTATVRMLLTGIQDTYLTKGVTGQTFGTIPATITVPTTFTTAVGPYEYVF
jgi:hypothetical protein